MSIALENNQVCRNGFLVRSCNLSILDLEDHSMVKIDERENGSFEFCSSSSSIGKNSDDDDDEMNNNDEEVESKLINNSLNSLEQALPFRRGISNFYTGKSKSYASLCDAACSSVKDIAKPENAYTRKRKNLLAYSILYDNKGRTSMLKSPGIGGGITKRAIHTSRSTLPLAIAMSSSESSIDENESCPEWNHANGSRTPSVSPPPSPLTSVPWRSFSVADLQHCAVSVGSVKSNLVSPVMGKNSKSDGVA